MAQRDFLFQEVGRPPTDWLPSGAVVGVVLFVLMLLRADVKAAEQRHREFLKAMDDRHREDVGEMRAEYREGSKALHEKLDRLTESRFAVTQS